MNGASRWLEASTGALALAASAVTARLAANILSRRLFDGLVSIAVTPRLSVAIPARLTRRRCRQPSSTQTFARIGPSRHLRNRRLVGCNRPLESGGRNAAAARVAPRARPHSDGKAIRPD